MIFVVKVTTNKEEQALELIAERARKRGLALLSLARPPGLKGYVLIEATNRSVAESAAFDLPYVKSILPRTVGYEDVRPMLQPSVAAIKIEKGDIVEIVSEPFKRDKAKVTRVDKAKGEVVVELLEAAVPIPITVSIDSVRVIRREKEEKEGEEKK